MKRVRIGIRDDNLHLVLGALLAGWGYEPAPAPALAAGKDTLPVLWLDACETAPAARMELTLPVVVEELWLALERHFHLPPRGHIRMALQLPVGLLARHTYADATLHSLSDMGGRIVHSRELARGEEVVLHVRLEEKIERLAAEVIYAMPKGEGTGGTMYDIGLIFCGETATHRAALRRQIVRVSLERALAGLVQEQRFAVRTLFSVS